MAQMEHQQPDDEAAGLANMSLEDKPRGDPPAGGDTLPRTPSGPEHAPPAAPEPRRPPANGSFPYAAYSGQPRAVGAPGGVAPRQLPPYVCTTSPAKAAAQKGARGDASQGSSSTGWGGMPLSPAGPVSPTSGGALSADLPSSLTDKDGALGPGSGGASATGTASEPGASPPPRRRSSRGAAANRSSCAFFLKTGSCAYGDRCKFDHPYDKAPKVVYNTMGLPMRPEEPPCAFFMKHAHCAFGHTCKYHHPELGAGAVPGSPLAGGPPAPAPAPAAHPPPPQMMAYPQGHAPRGHPYYAVAAMHQYQQMAAGGHLPDGSVGPHPMSYAFYRGGMPGGAYPVGMGPHHLHPGAMYAYAPMPGGMMAQAPSGARDGGGGRARGVGLRGGGRVAPLPPPPSAPVNSRRDSGASPLGSPRAPPTLATVAAATPTAMGLPVYTPKPMMVFNSPVKAEMAAVESD